MSSTLNLKCFVRDQQKKMDFLLSIVLVNFCIYPFKGLQNLCPCRYIPEHTAFKILFLCLKSVAYMDYIYFMYFIEFPRWLSGRESTCHCRRRRFDSWVGKIPWSRNGNTLQDSWLENPMDSGTWQAAVHGLLRVRLEWATEWNDSPLSVCLSVWQRPSTE